MCIRDRHYDYGFRIYDPGIGKFLSVDPLTREYPWYTPYQFAGNMPTQAIDLDGLEPVVEQGILIGYNVQKNQGPTQIQLDINNPRTQQKYGYNLHQKVEWTDIVYANISKFENVTSGEGQAFDKKNPDFKSGNIQPNMFLMINGGVPKGIIEEPIDDTNPKGASPIIGATNDGIGGLGSFWIKDSGRFGYRKSSKNLFEKIKSVRRYDNGWTGNRY